MRTKPLLVCLVLGACASAKSGTTLAESIHAYNEGVRWQRYEYAAVHVPPKERSEFIDAFDERSKDLRITEYEIVRVTQKNDKLAQVQVKMSWYLDSEGTLRETSAVQTWEKHGKTWWVVEETRLRGKEMPGLREDPSAEGAPTEKTAVAAPDETQE
jgi:hypothetical protein